MPWDTWEQLTLDHDVPTRGEVTAARARAEGIGNAEANASPSWKAAAAEAVRWCAGTLTTFTTDDVLLRLDAVGAPRTHTLTALGPVMLAAARSGVIAKTGELRPTRLAQRHRDLTVWASAPWVHR